MLIFVTTQANHHVNEAKLLDYHGPSFLSHFDNPIQEEESIAQNNHKEEEQLRLWCQFNYSI